MFNLKLNQLYLSILWCFAFSILPTVMVQTTIYDYSNHAPSVIFGDVEVTQNCTHWLCDRIMCPNKTERCFVEKYKSPLNPEMLVRINICYSANDTVLFNKTFQDAIRKHETVKFKLDVHRDGDRSSIYQLEHSYKNSFNADFDVHSEGDEFSETDEEQLKASLNEFENNEKDMENNLDMEFLNFDKIGQHVENNVRKVNQEIENQLQDIRDQMSRTFSNLFALG